MSQVMPGSKITMHFSLSLEDGTEAVSSFDEEPLVFMMGDKTLQPGLELGLYGLKEGAKQTLTLTPEQAYGEHEAGLLQTMPRSNFSAEMKLKEGLVIAFETAEGEEAPGIIMALRDDEVDVDFNHPLAGHNVIYKVQILKIEIP